jgi:hypothetical protein
MSLDVSVWTPSVPHLPEDLPDSAQWARYGDTVAYEASDWQVVAVPGDEEPPPDVLAALPSASAVVHFSLEPIGAPDEGYAWLERVVRHLATVLQGVWVDPNGNAFLADSGHF